jgi:sugar phosphate isomerase/epimerase
MNRRQFSKKSVQALLAIGFTPAFIGAASLPVTEKIRLGGPLHGKYESPEEWIKLLQKNNYRAAYCPIGIDSTREEIQAYAHAAAKADIIISEVGAWSNPISPDSKTASDAFEKCVQSLQLAEDIGANCCVNIAGSKNPEVWAGPHENNFLEETFDEIVETTRNIIDSVNPSRTSFTLECMPWIFPESADSYLRLIKAMDRKAFAVHLDPVNIMISPEVFFHNGVHIKECFKKLGPYIKSCHAKDLILKQDTFMPQFEEVRPGLGGMNYSVFLNELSKYPKVPLMMEHLNSQAEYEKAAAFIRGKAKEEQVAI